MKKYVDMLIISHLENSSITLAEPDGGTGYYIYLHDSEGTKIKLHVNDIHIVE